MADKKSRGINVKINVDVAEALTGLKAVQREAKKAAQALREAENAQYQPRIDVANDLLRIQGEDGSWNHDAYMFGMYNGMELILATIEGRDPSYRSKPEFISEV